MLRRRIERRMMFLAIRDLEEYASRLSVDGDEARALRKDLLIGVTGFFRDPEVYDALRRHLLRYLSGMRNGDQFRAWLPACATGEEAYSIAMLLAEGMEAAGVRLDVKIFATDIDEEALVQAARAQYPVSNSKDMAAAQLARYFYNDGNVLTVRPVLREMVIFARHNLVRDPPFARLDLVSCRNFLIYATNEFQTEVLRSLHFGLKQGGLLLLGSSETLGSLEREYQPVAAGQRLFSKSSRAVLRGGRRTGDAVGGGAWRGRAARAEAERDDGLRQVVELLAAERGSTVVTTNDEGVLLEVIADELGVFRLPKGKPSNDLLRLANFELAGALRMVWHRAKTGEDTLNYLADFPATTGGRAALSARRLAATGPLPERILITIEPVAPAGIEARPESHGFGDAAQRIEHLERELRDASENLQSTIEELDNATEEQQMTLQDLQAAAEELQSTNEELATVNAEQQKRLHEVAVLNADLKNLLYSVNVGTLFLDAKLRIRRFTSGVDEIIKLMDRDVGRVDPLQGLYPAKRAINRQAHSDETPVPSFLCANT
jgi:two-component system CheB/CheR fusion protein